MVQAHAGDDSPRHFVAARFRQGNVPRAILDQFYFDADELRETAPELDFVRPNVNTRVVGIDYTLALSRDNAGLQFWGERFSTPIEPGLWDDREEPPEHSDAEWFAPKDLGAWAGGVNIMYNLPILTSSPKVEIKLSMGGGLGVGGVTGQADVWKDGRQEDLGDPTCLAGEDAAPAPQRLQCAPDGQVALPAVIPFVDLTIGPRIRILNTLVLRGDFGFHDSLYWGVGAGAAF